MMLNLKEKLRFQMKKKPVAEEGDVLLLTDGRLARITSSGLGSMETYFMMQFIDTNGETMQLDDGTLHIEQNLGQTKEILAAFYAARSIHIRLSNAKLFS